ncbi:ATP synthase complex assembly protein atp12 [Nowakowskiella sp. JEL0407]|nr:ATP synthase complex assembly protein atp12 [Nowakowskiella sp. JEL0407]
MTSPSFLSQSVVFDASDSASNFLDALSDDDDSESVLPALSRLENLFSASAAALDTLKKDLRQNSSLKKNLKDLQFDHDIRLNELKEIVKLLDDCQNDKLLLFKEHQQSISTISQKDQEISTLTDKLWSLSSEITTLQSSLSTSEQNSTDTILSLRAQVKEIESMAKKEIENINHELESEFDIERTELNALIESATKERDSVVEQLENLRKEVESFKSDHETLKTEYSNLQSQSQEFTETISKLQSENDSLEERIVELQMESTDTGSTIANLQNENKQLISQCDELQQRVNALVLENQALQGTADESKASAEHLHVEIEQLRTAKDENETVITSLRSEIESLNSKYTELQSSSIESSQIITNLTEQLAESQQQNEKLQEDFTNAQSLLSSLQTEKGALQAQVAELTTESEESVNIVTKLSSENDHLTKTNAQLKTEISGWEEKLASSESELTSTIQELQTNLSTLQTQNESLEIETTAAQAETNSLKSETNTLKSQITEMQSESAESVLIIQSLREENDDLQSRNTRMQSKLDEFERAAVEVTKSVEEFERRLSEKETEVSESVSELEKVQVMYEKLQAEYMDADTTVTNLKSTNAELETQIGNLETKISEQTSTISQLTSETETLRQRLQSETAELSNSVHALRSEVQTLQDQNSKLEAANVDFELEIMEMNKNLERKSEEYFVMQEQMKKAKIVALDQERERVGEFEARVEELEDEVAQLRNGNRNLEEKLGGVVDESEYLDVKMKYEGLQSRLEVVQAQLDREIEEKNVLSKDLEKLKGKYSTLVEEHSETKRLFSEKLKDKTAECEEKETAHATLQKEYQKLDEEISKLEKEHENAIRKLNDEIERKSAECEEKDAVISGLQGTIDEFQAENQKVLATTEQLQELTSRMEEKNRLQKESEEKLAKLVAEYKVQQSQIDDKSKLIMRKEEELQVANENASKLKQTLVERESEMKGLKEKVSALNGEIEELKVKLADAVASSDGKRAARASRSVRFQEEKQEEAQEEPTPSTPTRSSKRKEAAVSNSEASVESSPTPTKTKSPKRKEVAEAGDQSTPPDKRMRQTLAEMAATPASVRKGHKEEYKYVITASGLKADEKSNLVKIIKNMPDCKFSTSIDDFDMETTHLITSRESKTLKFYTTIIKGGWLIFDQNWVNNSFKSGHWIPETPYGWRTDINPFLHKKVFITPDFYKECSKSAAEMAKQKTVLSVLKVGEAEIVDSMEKAELIVKSGKERKKEGVEGEWVDWSGFLALIPAPTKPGRSSRLSNDAAFEDFDLPIIRKAFCHSSKSCRKSNELEFHCNEFWKSVAVESSDDGYFYISLDKKPLKSPSGNIIKLSPNQEIIANLVAAEWESQEKQLKSSTLPMTSLVVRALDSFKSDTEGVRSGVLQNLIRYLNTDALCFRQPYPASFNEKQLQCWNPIISKIEQKYNIKINTTEGFTNVQPPQTVEQLMKVIEGYNAFELAAFERCVMTTKSFILGLSIMDGLISVEDAHYAARLEVLQQIDVWGEVEDAHDVDREELKKQLGSAACIRSFGSKE